MELKKNPRLDYRKKYALFFNIGLVASLLIVISAFELKFEEQVSTVEFEGCLFPEDMLSPPVTEITPPKPKVQVITVNEVPDEIEIDEEEFEAVIVFEEEELPEVTEVIFEEKEEIVEEAIYIAETMPSFEGGYAEFYKFVSKHLKYPSTARRMQIEGKVFVHFVVEKDGSLGDINIAKGIGAGCDEEVLRIVGMSPNWKPGKQQGRPVRVHMMLPITFRLQ